MLLVPHWGMSARAHALVPQWVFLPRSLRQRVALWHSSEPPLKSPNFWGRVPDPCTQVTWSSLGHLLRCLQTYILNLFLPATPAIYQSSETFFDHRRRTRVLEIIHARIDHCNTYISNCRTSSSLLATRPSLTVTSWTAADQQPTAIIVRSRDTTVTSAQ